MRDRAEPGVEVVERAPVLALRGSCCGGRTEESTGE